MRHEPALLGRELGGEPRRRRLNGLEARCQTMGDVIELWMREQAFDLRVE
ncbi:MAG TPA: hypothetical protein VIU82_15625 [Bosea sp. (in: a-proteobacteria)]